MKINQYCSVCKKHLDMEVIPTDDGGDDGVIWLRCPECQGFLPKFTGEGLKTESGNDAATTGTASPPTTTSETSAATGAPPTAPARREDSEPADASAPEDEDEAAEAAESGGEVEPMAEYAARLAEADTTSARPYRPSSSYEVGEVILHLAYDDVGIVVAKERLPGGRKAIKVYFDGAGVMHLIEQAADGH